jgi:hypothetical protein
MPRKLQQIWPGKIDRFNDRLQRLVKPAPGSTWMSHRIYRGLNKSDSGFWDYSRNKTRAQRQLPGSFQRKGDYSPWKAESSTEM